MTKKETKRRETKTDRAQKQLRKRLWAGIGDEQLWHRDDHVGFTTIPRGLQHVMQIMDSLSKGKPLSATYFTLWCWVREASVVDIKSPAEFAFESGFTGQRAESTWRERMRILSELGFIKVEEGRYGPFSHVLIMNPHLAVERLHDSGKVQSLRFNALVARLEEVGESDLTGY